MSASAGRIMMIPKGAYDASTTYSILDIVTYQGSSYIAKGTTIGHAPTDTTYWQPVADTSAKMDRSVYDSNNSGVVDNAERVNNHTVAKDVPANAQFTDTKTLAGMTDTTINNPSDGQTLRYNATTQKFENGTVASTFNDLTDTNFSNLQDGQVPMYDAGTSKWINADVEGLIPIVTWADGTDDQIATMLEAHYQGLIDVRDYWTVGDERVVHLSAMAATGVTDSHDAQDVTLVLMHEGGKTLTNAIGNITECAFIVGQKKYLIMPFVAGNFQGGYINPSGVSINGGWDICARRTWCNSVYKNAVPATLRGIFKQFQNKGSDGETMGNVTVSNDYFALPAEKEVMGNTTAGGDPVCEADLIQFDYFKTPANRDLHPASQEVGGWRWWTRSPEMSGYGTKFVAINDYDTTQAEAQTMTDLYGIAPFGVI